MVGFPGGTFLPLPPLLIAVQWELNTIEDNKACPYLGPDHKKPCLWCFQLNTAEWTADIFSDMESYFHEMAHEMAVMSTLHPGIRYPRKSGEANAVRLRDGTSGRGAESDDQGGQ